MSISTNLIILKPKEFKHLKNDYSWRKDKELSQLDAVEPIKMSFDEFQHILKQHGKSSHPALISKLANKAYKDGVGDLVFTRLYDNNIKLTIMIISNISIIPSWFISARKFCSGVGSI